MIIFPPGLSIFLICFVLIKKVALSDFRATRGIVLIGNYATLTLAYPQIS